MNSSTDLTAIIFEDNLKTQNKDKKLDDKSNIKKENCCSYLSNCIHNCLFCCFMCFN